jgi:hypothetical protein
VEGAPRPRQNSRNSAAAIAHNLARWDPKHSQALFLQLSVARCIAKVRLVRTVDVPVDLDYEGGLTTVEVHHVRIDRVLPSKLQPGRALAKLLP